MPAHYSSRWYDARPAFHPRLRAALLRRGVCYAGDSARAAPPCEVCLKVSEDSTRVIIARCPKDSTTLYHVRRIGRKYQIETIVFLRGKGE